LNFACHGRIPPRRTLAQITLCGNRIRRDFFVNKTTTEFSATAGASLNFDHVFGDAPLECGYRFFYLGQGSFNVINDQVKNTLKTGTVYANAVMCSVVI